MTQCVAQDIAALACFAACWIGYTWFADHFSRDRRTVMAAAMVYRLRWMERMMKREMRMGDINIVAAISRSSSLFVTTSMFILAGLVAILGALDKAREVVSGFSFVIQASREMWELKILLLILVFVYAFFKFVWSLRQHNMALMLIGAAPLVDELDAPDRASFPRRSSRILSLAVDSFNRGVRAYYFGLATLGWFVHPLVFGCAAVWVVLVLYRREFRSNTLKALLDPDGGAE